MEEETENIERTSTQNSTDKPKGWSEYLPSVENFYNNRITIAVGLSTLYIASLGLFKH